ncbi:hypothetical protein NBT05_01515 [Aquimarina sp. ERC-38]|uniref:hypothetical protein n=1 Tax=Aquimarina sp. ERC-38 TaxID=2949996 RepID=UPI0022464EE7|nr:hypothetical protein [Aquimarina sp. ERC-38]UZO81165.1 hypothetical protein NBT05_01515 [Aquimarina sp. ERC-38]
MKVLNIKIAFCFLILLYATTYAQDFNQNTKWMSGWTNFDPNMTAYPDTEESIPNAITRDTFLSNDTVWLLSGDVYVTENAILTIEEGTIIRGDHKNPGNLFVTRGSKLIAVGSEVSPIVFTSNKPAKARKSGDWGGIIIAGNGFVNTVSGSSALKSSFSPQYSVYGGQRYEEQTVLLTNVRIEFAGNNVKSGENASGLTLLGIGTGSMLSNIMVSYSGQDSFSWKGGNNDAGNLVSYKAADDDFQMVEGYQGIIDHLTAIRHPFITSPRGSYAIEINGFNKNGGLANQDKVTDVTITNASLINLSDAGNYMHTTAAIAASNMAKVYLNSSKISGFSDIVKFDTSYTSLSFIRKAFGMDNSFFNIHKEGVQVAFKPADGVLDILKYNRFTQEFVDVQTLFTDPQSTILPKFELQKSKNTYMVMQ